MNPPPDLFGGLPFNLSSEEQRAPAAPTPCSNSPREMFTAAEVHSTAPTALDAHNGAELLRKRMDAARDAGNVPHYLKLRREWLAALAEKPACESAPGS